MFCPKCGTENPNDARFCRTCRTDIGVVSEALSGKHRIESSNMFLSRRGRPITWESAVTKLFFGMAFLGIAFVLASTGLIGGKMWWFWMLIPAFMSMGSGIGQILQLKTHQQKPSERTSIDGTSSDASKISHSETPTLSAPASEPFAPMKNRYTTGELVAPPSVAEGTTRLLDPDRNG